MSDVLTLIEVADELRMTGGDSWKRRKVRALINAGHLHAINDQVWPGHWTVSRYELNRYIGGEQSGGAA
jgi:hypothetical protein